MTAGLIAVHAVQGPPSSARALSKNIASTTGDKSSTEIQASRVLNDRHSVLLDVLRQLKRFRARGHRGGCVSKRRGKFCIEQEPETLE